MLWKNRRQSSNIQDRRGISPGGIAVGGGVGTLVLLLIGMFLGVDPSQLMQQLPQGGAVPGGQEVPTGAPGGGKLRRGGGRPDSRGDALPDCDARR